MNRTVEEIIKDMKNNLEYQEKLRSEFSDLVNEMSRVEKEQWDWVSVKRACEILDVSPALIYNKINKGILTTKRIDSKIFIDKKELEQINDI